MSEDLKPVVLPAEPLPGDFPPYSTQDKEAKQAAKEERKEEKAEAKAERKDGDDDGGDEEPA